jgi:CHRD domain-containing protein
MNKHISATWLRPLAAVVFTSMLALLTAGCGGGGGGTPAAPPPATTLSAVLSATQEVPPTTSTAAGTATVTVDAAKTTIIVTMNTTGLTNVTASHIHFGKAGANGGVLFSLFAAPATFTSPLIKTLTSADFTATTGVATFAEAVDAILAGNTYINVHTQVNTGGEIRGQVGPVSLAAATMTGGQENPPVTSAASGNATVKFDNTQSTITVTLNTTGLTNVTASHIHFGKPGANGGVLFSLFAAPATFTSPLTKTLTSADFTADAANGINTFSDAVNAILSGNTYVNVHTPTNTGGEIRGQVGPAAFKATLNGATEVPAVVSPATGTATVRLNADQTAIALNMTTQGFVNTVTASHIHFGAAGANGGVLFSLFAAPGAFPATLSKTLTSADFTADATNGVTTFANALNAMLSSKTYINVHTNINTGGEIRGQVTP